MSIIKSRKRDREIAHVDDTSRVKIGLTLFSAPISGSSKERQTFLGEGEHSVKVQCQDFGPSVVLGIPTIKVQSPSRKLDHETYGIIINLVSPSGSGVID